jgi:hypothetical protein
VNAGHADCRKIRKLHCTAGTQRGTTATFNCGTAHRRCVRSSLTVDYHQLVTASHDSKNQEVRLSVTTLCGPKPQTGAFCKHLQSPDVQKASFSGRTAELGGCAVRSRTHAIHCFQLSGIFRSQGSCSLFGK